ncbi:MAG: hypothetical protein ACJ8DC_00445 [Gemmatimonadales bacterium]
MLRLRTLGGLALEGHPSDLTGAATQPRPLALLALLAVAGERGMVRDELLLHLWPDSTPDRARNVLKQTLYALRRDLKAPDLVLGPNSLRLNPLVITSDLAEVKEALASGDLTRVQALYRGPFLEGFHLRESPEFEQWREQEAARLSQLIAGAVQPRTMLGDAPQATIPRARRRRPSRWLTVAVGALAIALPAAVWHARARDRSESLKPNLVFIAPFAVFDDRLALWREGVVDVLARDLDGAGPLRSVTPAVALRRAEDHASPQSVADLARSSGAGLAVSGAVLSAGRDSVRLSASVLDVAMQLSLGDADIRGPIGRMDQLTDSLAVTLLRELSRTRSITAVRSGSMRATSLPALKAFLQGEQFFRHAAFDSAISYYETAISLDSTLALAYYRLANAMGWMRPGTELIQQAYSLRAGALTRGLAPADSLLLTAHALFATAIATATRAGSSDADPELAREGAPGLSGAGLTQVNGWWEVAQRLFTTLEIAVRRYPDNPDIWYHLGEARVHFGPLFGIRQADALAAFDRAIALDSSFAPAYEHTVDLALDVGGMQAARHHARAYLDLDPASVSAPVLTAFLAVSQAGIEPDSVARVLAALATDTQMGLIYLFKRDSDSTEIAVRLLRGVLTADPASVPPSTRRLGIRVFSYRGHLREALAQSRYWTDAKLYPFAARFGIMPRDSAGVVFSGWLAGRSLRASQALPWWAWSRDTTALQDFVRWQGSAAVSVTQPYVRAAHRYWTNAGRGFLALADGDSAGALRWLALAPDSVCAACLQERLTRAQLLVAAGRLREAAAILEDERQWIDSSPTPIEVLWALEHGRVAERLGERSQAIKSYRLAADAWRHADPELRPFASEAREGLTRLGSDGRSTR